MAEESSADETPPRPPVPAFIQPYPGAPPQPNPAARQHAGPPYAPPPGAYGSGRYPPVGYPQPARYPHGRYPPGRYPATAYGTSPDARPKTLAVIALVAAILGVVLIFVPVIGFVSSAFLLAAVVLGIIALASRRQGGKGLGVTALVVAVAGGLVAWVVMAVVFGLIVSADARRGDPFVPEPVPTYAPPDQAEPTDGDDGSRGTQGDPYAYGDIVTISDRVTGDPIWEMSVGAPVDLTAELAAGDLYNPTPDNGAYTGIPVTLTYVGEKTLDPWIDYDWNVSTTWVGPGGDPKDEEYVLLPNGLVHVMDVDPMSPGETVTVHTVIDAPLDAPGSVVTTIGWDYELYWAAPR